MNAGFRNTKAGSHVARRGAAMIEFVLVLPLIFAILGFTWFFGWAMKNQQHVRIADRYVTWSRLKGTNVSEANLNDRYFGGDGRDVRVDFAGQGDSLVRDYVDTVGNFGPDGWSVADAAVGHWPAGMRGTVGARFPSDIELWQDVGLNQPLRSTHHRQGRPWVRGEAAVRPTIIQQYFQSLDQAMLSVETPGDQLARRIISSYHNGW